MNLNNNATGRPLILSPLTLVLLSLASLSGCRSADVATPRGGFDIDRMVWAEEQIDRSIEEGAIPGAVLLVGRGEDTVYRKAFGQRAVQPTATPMTTDTIFDMASISKVVGCATSIMILVERGQLNLTDKVAKYIPAFGNRGKEKITVEQLLLHRAGFIPDNPLADYRDGPAQAIENIHNLKLIYSPGTDFRYTDVGYIMLGELVRVIDGRPLNQFAREEIFEPLGMRDTFYNPPAEVHARCAPTEQREGRWMIGEVHDPRAYLLGGVAGHAGLFSTADDMARWCRMILNGGELDGQRVLSELTVREMTRPRCLESGGGCRGYGFGVGSTFSSARGNLFQPGVTFGHTGFTGTLMWFDPQHETFVLLLTNRVHPNGKGSVIDLRRRVVTVVASAIRPLPGEQASPIVTQDPLHGTMVQASGGAAGQEAPAKLPADVLCGIDVLQRDGFRVLDGKKVAVITNHTGLDRDGNHLVDLLVNAPNVEVVRLLSPEHGLYGVLDEHVGDTVDPKTGLKVFSLYGKTRRPTPEMLEGIDAIVFDIQDIGTRFYTYISTMGNAMEEAVKRDIEVVVLDRPNPIRGLATDGPISDEKYLGFTSFRRLPLVHGMTVGELAEMFNTHHGIGCKLTVVKLEGWRRAMWWDETGLMWTNPSPNMRNLTQAAIYPAIGMLESSNLSVGRGTDQPFEFFGAPWIDGRKLAEALNGEALPGLRFIPIRFTPESSKFKGEACQGVYVLVTDRNVLEPARSGLTIAWHLRRLFGDAFEIDRIGRMVMNDEVMAALKRTSDPDQLARLWERRLDEFEAIRTRYLFYP